jgi:HAD superfamily hydrolase (TIGR01509 family)
MSVAPAIPRTAAPLSIRPPRRAPLHVLPSPVPATRPIDLEALAVRWQRAFDAADRGLSVGGRTMRDPDLLSRRRALVHERRETAELLARVAAVGGTRTTPWLSPVPITPSMLGLDDRVRACIFDLDGVLTNSAALHAYAWGEVFDDFLLRLSDKTGWQFIPFDRDADYRAYVDGRSRMEGVHSFLGSRGIRVPEGTAGDPTEDTAQGLAARKGEAMSHGLHRRGVAALDGARRYLEAAGRSGLGRAVISASASTMPMLELAALTQLVDEHVDADVILTEGLRSRPAPDLLLVACTRLGVEPADAVAFTHGAAGVAAGHAAGMMVVGVAEGAQAERLAGFGAERVVRSLDELLDRRLAVTAPA